jgi:hypothetical protein
MNVFNKNLNKVRLTALTFFCAKMWLISPFLTE